MSVVKLGSRAAFAAIFASFVGLYLGAGAPAPLLVLYEQRFGFPAWELTVAFSAYAIGLVLSLLTIGGLSDFLGRRPVLIGALALQVVSILLFIFAKDVGWIIAARSVQGVATGTATSAFTAMMIELAPEHRKRLGALLASISPAIGMTLGVFIAGAFAQVSRDPETVVFTILGVVVLAGIVAVFLTRETIAPAPGAIRSMIPRIVVPRSARVEFAASVPVNIATWMLVALFIGLAPLVLRDVFHIPSGFLSAAAVAIQPAFAAISSLAFGRFDARKVTIAGGAIVFVGVAVVVCSFLIASLPLMLVGAAISGTGFGTSTSGPLRLLAPLAPAHERAGLFAAFYLLAYAAFGIPVVIAGFVIDSLGLQFTSVIYGVVVMVFAAIGFVSQLARLRADRAGTGPAESGRTN